MVTFNFKSPKTIGGEKTGKVGRPKGCKLVNKVHRDGESQRGGSLGSGSNNPNAKPVIQLNIYGEFIKEWRSVIEAAKALQIDNSAIAKCCRHVPKYKRAGGYVWEYKENYGD